MTFDGFYEKYPRHEHRKDGERAWRALNPTEELAMEIAASVEKHQATVWLGRSVKFIPLCATYLRGALWEDECPGEPKPGCAESLPERSVYHEAWLASLDDDDRKWLAAKATGAV